MRPSLRQLVYRLPFAFFGADLPIFAVSTSVRTNSTRAPSTCSNWRFAELYLYVFTVVFHILAAARRRERVELSDFRYMNPLGNYALLSLGTVDLAIFQTYQNRLAFPSRIYSDEIASKGILQEENSLPIFFAQFQFLNVVGAPGYQEKRQKRLKCFLRLLHRLLTTSHAKQKSLLAGQAGPVQRQGLLLAEFSVTVRLTGCARSPLSCRRLSCAHGLLTSCIYRQIPQTTPTAIPTAMLQPTGTPAMKLRESINATDARPM